MSCYVIRGALTSGTGSGIVLFDAAIRNRASRALT